MRRDLLERALWGATVAVTLVMVIGARASTSVSPSVSSLPVAPMVPSRFAADSLENSAEYIVQHDLFRLSRRPPTVAYSPALEGMAPPPTAPLIRPSFVVRGIVGGPPWSAIVEGIPGREGSVLVRKGDTIPPFVVRGVGRDTVVINGADTTWRLTVRRSW